MCTLLYGSVVPAQSIVTLSMQAEMQTWSPLRFVCGRCILLLDLGSAPSDAGINLLDLPQEVLHAIFSHMKAHEWAQGPAQSCHFLSRMDLPRLALQLPVRLQSCACHI